MAGASQHQAPAQRPHGPACWRLPTQKPRLLDLATASRHAQPMHGQCPAHEGCCPGYHGQTPHGSPCRQLLLPLMPERRLTVRMPPGLAGGGPPAGSQTAAAGQPVGAAGRQPADAAGRLAGAAGKQQPGDAAGRQPAGRRPADAAGRRPADAAGSRPEAAARSQWGAAAGRCLAHPSGTRPAVRQHAGRPTAPPRGRAAAAAGRRRLCPSQRSARRPTGPRPRC
mmetsp:Transcript_14805/g.43200  ORF Transcript_14805/g.43200 Transcript_14805/m.43200 type:complete len:225 (+) Transcript_14805:860-1534(+)